MSLSVRIESQNFLTKGPYVTLFWLISDTLPHGTFVDNCPLLTPCGVTFFILHFQGFFLDVILFKNVFKISKNCFVTLWLIPSLSHVSLGDTFAIFLPL